MEINGKNKKERWLAKILVAHSANEWLDFSNNSLATFRSEYEIDYEYNFRISNQSHSQALAPPCCWPVEKEALGTRLVLDALM